MKVWVTSDTHYTHLNLILYCNRPWNIFEIMINNHNEVVADDDLVIYVGDVGAPIKHDTPFLIECFKRQKGNKILLKGNHDVYSNSFYKEKLGFKKVEEYMIIKECLLYHYPLPLKNSEHCSPRKAKKIERIEKIYQEKNLKGVIHGHVHNTGDWQYDNHYNVCTDRHNYYPLELNSVINNFI